MKRKAFFYLVILIIISFIFPNCKQNNKEIKIGVILPLTGSAAVWGNNALMGIKLANKELVEDGYKVNLIIEDSKSETNSAVNALQKLISIDNIQVVIGDIASSSVLAMAPIAEKNKVLLLSPGASNPDISSAGDYIFRNWQSDALEGEKDANFVYNRLSKKQAAILFVNNAYGNGLKKAFSTTFKKLGGEVLLEVSFEQDATDVKSQLQKLKDAKVNIVYMPGYPNEMALALKQSKELNFNPQYISTQSFDDPKILEIAGDAANNVIYSIPAPPDSTNKVVKSFAVNYEKMFNLSHGVCSDTGYDALKLLVYQIVNLKTFNGTYLKEALYKVKNYNGASGIITFNKDGDVEKNFIFNQILNKKSTVYGKR